MFTENSQEAGGQAQAQEQQQQQQDIFDTPFEIQEEDNGDIPFSGFEDEQFNQEEQGQGGEAGEQQQQEQGQAAGEHGGEQAQEEQKSVDELLFGAKKDGEQGQAAEQKEAETPEEKLIEQLKAKGYDVSKQENQTLETKYKDELSQIDSYVKNANDFLKLDDSAVIQQQETSLLASKYKREGKQHLIGGELFKEELEANVEEITSNPMSKRLYADNVRKDIEKIVSENTTRKSAIDTEIKTEQDTAIQQNRLNLQNGFKEIFEKKSFLGMELSSEDINTAYQSVNNRELSQKLNENPGLVAKVALFVNNLDKLEQASQKGTYGEGVKAAVDRMITDGSSKSSLSKGMSSRGGGSAGEVQESYERFSKNVVETSQESKPKNDYVAGAGRW